MLQIVLSGLAIGSAYGLVGMALAISFYVTRVINFAQGQLMPLMIGAEETYDVAVSRAAIVDPHPENLVSGQSPNSLRSKVAQP